MAYRMNAHKDDNEDMRTFVLLLRCRDKKGIVAGVSDFIFKHGGNIIDLDQHSTDPEGGYFFMRVEFTVRGVNAHADGLSASFRTIAKRLGASWSIYDKTPVPRMGILVSAPDHCLLDILYMWRSGDLRAEIPFVISNCEKHRIFVERYGVDFKFIGSSKKDKRESDILAAVKGTTDFLVLARYMLILSRDFLKNYGKDVINIHHGFLPSFKGPDPYGQALHRGVKVIGATAHFVNEKLDDGPIIAQAVERISHKDGMEELIRKGKNLEKRALSDAVSSYTDHRVMRHRDTTVVF